MSYFNIPENISAKVLKYGKNAIENLRFIAVFLYFSIIIQTGFQPEP